jgi:hypothetical protein
MAANMHPVGNTSYSRGFTLKQVKIIGIDSDGLASCDDSTGNLHAVRTDITRAKGNIPQVGENWIITKDLGAWTFGAIINYQPQQGRVTLLPGNSSVAVVFPNPEPDASYGMLLTPSFNTTVWYTGRTTTGFNINTSSTSGSNQNVTWQLVR